MLTDVSSLKGVALDYALARAKDLVPSVRRDNWFPHRLEVRDVRSEDGNVRACGTFTHMRMAQSLLNEERITIIAPDFEVGHWTAIKRLGPNLIQCSGETFEVAIARCYVTLHSGSKVNVPDDVLADSLI